MRYWVAGMFAAVLSTTAWGSPPQMTAEELGGVCGKGDVKSEQVCSRFIADIHAAALEYGVACDRGNAGSIEARRYILLYARENPQDANKPASEVALDALSQAYPCR